eukprot:jgi/Chlat1/4356/Chrsp29S04506
MATTWAGQSEFEGLLKDMRKPTASKISELVKFALQHHQQFYKHVVALIEKHVQKRGRQLCGLYTIDAICKAAPVKFGNKDRYVPRFERTLPKTMATIGTCQPEELPSVKKVVALWRQRSMFSSQVLDEVDAALASARPASPRFAKVQNNSSQQAAQRIVDSDKPSVPVLADIRLAQRPSELAARLQPVDADHQEQRVLSPRKQPPRPPPPPPPPPGPPPMSASKVYPSNDSYGNGRHHAPSASRDEAANEPYDPLAVGGMEVGAQGRPAATASGRSWAPRDTSAVAQPDWSRPVAEQRSGWSQQPVRPSPAGRSWEHADTTSVQHDWSRQPGDHRRSSPPRWPQQAKSAYVRGEDHRTDNKTTHHVDGNDWRDQRHDPSSGRASGPYGRGERDAVDQSERRDRDCDRHRVDPRKSDSRGEHDRGNSDRRSQHSDVEDRGRSRQHEPEEVPRVRKTGWDQREPDVPAPAQQLQPHTELSTHRPVSQDVRPVDLVANAPPPPPRRRASKWT